MPPSSHQHTLCTAGNSLKPLHQRQKKVFFHPKASTTSSSPHPKTMNRPVHVLHKGRERREGRGKRGEERGEGRREEERECVPACSSSSTTWSLQAPPGATPQQLSCRQSPQRQMGPPKCTEKEQKPKNQLSRNISHFSLSLLEWKDCKLKPA